MNNRLSFIVYRLSLVVFLFILSSVLCPLSSVHAESVSSSDLIENAKALDGKTVTYKGELISTVLNRGDYSWVNLNDGYNAIGVWCKSSQLAPVKFAGDYGHTGDIIEVTGMFNRACPVHNGELDIHAFKTVIAQEGSARDIKIDRNRARLAVIVFSTLLLVVLVFRKRI